VTPVHELELDLDAFEGPFDLLLTLLLKEELEPAEIDMAAIVVAFVERLSRPWPASATAGQSPAPPTPDAAGGAPADGPYSNTVPPAYAPPAAPQERADEPGQETESPSERNSEWIARSA